MATLTVWKYDTVDAAGEAAQLLRSLARANLLVVRDAATVTWEHGQTRPRAHQLGPSSTGTGALGGGFWGLLFGLIFFMPLLGAAIGASTGTLAGTLADVGIGDPFINRVRDSVTPGTSALFVLTSDGALDQVHEALARGPAGELIFTELTAEQETALRDVFAD